MDDELITGRRYKIVTTQNWKFSGYVTKQTDVYVEVFDDKIQNNVIIKKDVIAIAQCADEVIN